MKTLTALPLLKKVEATLNGLLEEISQAIAEAEETPSADPVKAPAEPKDDAPADEAPENKSSDDEADDKTED